LSTPTRDVILVVDDDLQVAHLLTSALEGEGYDTLEANTGEDGVDLATLHHPALILLDMVLPDIDGFEVCSRISQDLSLKHIPVIAVTGHSDARDRLTEAIGCIDDYIFKPFDIRDLLIRVKLSLKRTRLMAGSSPLTGLPGNVAIQDELLRRIEQKQLFALLYVDLDEFKAFNDHYGFLRGDEAIKLLSRCCREAVTTHATNGFVGHIGGDDLALVVEPDVAQAVSRQIVGAWEDLASHLYEPEDAERGYIEVTDRRGQLQRFPLASVSIGVASNAIRPIHTHWEAAEIASEMKHVAKSRQGSAIAIDRRRQILESETQSASV
jgi:diguanylate cyclase (GGDEF)-like protein